MVSSFDFGSAHCRDETHVKSELGPDSEVKPETTASSATETNLEAGTKGREKTRDSTGDRTGNRTKAVTETDTAREENLADQRSPSRSGKRARRFLRRHRAVGRVALFVVVTGWWVASLALHRRDRDWISPFLVWLAVALRLVFWYVPTGRVTSPIKFVWASTAGKVHEAIPTRLRTPAGALVTVAVIVTGTFLNAEFADNTRANRAVSLVGQVVVIVAMWLASRDRARIRWRAVIGGMLAQYLIAVFVLRTSVGYGVFRWLADRAADLLGCAREGVAFLTDPATSRLLWFLIGVVPAVVFFVALVHLAYHAGFLQWLVGKLAALVFWALAVSGAEAVVAIATPFVGQGESALLVKPFLPHMTSAELHQVLTCGFATISGSVLVGYVGMGLDAEALVSSCIMSIPASLAMSKLRYPETEDPLTAAGAAQMLIRIRRTTRTSPDDDHDYQPTNALHAFATGAWLGITVGGSIVGNLLCVMAAVSLVNGLLGWWGSYLNIKDPPLSLQLILGYVLVPVAFLLGVPRDGNMIKVASLIAEKIVTNEYVAFTKLANDPNYADLSYRSRLIATYACCGFGNLASLGVQIGILSQLAPSRGGDVSRLAPSAFVSGVIATLTSATVAGLVAAGRPEA